MWVALWLPRESWVRLQGAPSPAPAQAESRAPGRRGTPGRRTPLGNVIDLHGSPHSRGRTFRKSSWAFWAEPWAKGHKVHRLAVVGVVRDSPQHGARHLVHQAGVSDGPALHLASQGAKLLCSHSPHCGVCHELVPPWQPPPGAPGRTSPPPAAARAFASPSLTGQGTARPLPAGKGQLARGPLVQGPGVKVVPTQAVAMTTSPMWTPSPMPPATPRFSTRGTEKVHQSLGAGAAFTLPGEH